ncbi:MAG: alpha/beta hydrolase [Burkholderiaceae bacterium]
MIDWRSMPAEVLEANYNPRVAVADSQSELDALTAQSRQAATDLDGQCHSELDVRYGAGPLETLDLYRPLESDRLAPLVLFVHGGFWRALDKSDHTLVVPPLLARGAVVANVNYDLAPAITLDDMAAQIVRATRFCHAHSQAWGADPSRLILIGHSAGAHLAARVLNTPDDGDGLPANLVAGVAAISGIYEPEVILGLSVNQDAQVTKDVAVRNDCLTQPPGGQALVIAWAGGDEPEGWIDQTVRYSQVVKAADMECRQFVMPDTNHFTVLDASFKPGSRGYEAIGELIS